MNKLTVVFIYGDWKTYDGNIYGDWRTNGGNIYGILRTYNGSRMMAIGGHMMVTGRHFCLLNEKHLMHPLRELPHEFGLRISRALLV